jgi:histidinol phosphatase-like enzyme
LCAVEHSVGMNTMQISVDTYQLIIFGDFSVLTNVPFRDGLPLHMLAGRLEFLANLRQARRECGGPDLQFAVAANKGGVPFGLQTETEATEEVRWTSEQIGASAFAVCFAHPSPKPGYEQYALPELLKRRKPQPDMFEEIIAQLGVPRTCVLIVGNFSDDCRAAKLAGLAWQTTGLFFRDTERSEEGTIVSTRGGLNR